MRLSEIASLDRIDIVREGQFSTLGTVRHSRERLLVFLEDAAYLPRLLHNPNVACVITRSELIRELPDSLGVAVAEDPRRAFFTIHNHLAERTDFYCKDFPSAISPQAVVSTNAYVADRNVRIGAGTVIEAGATILERTVIGENARIRPGVVLGSQGFEFKRLGDEIVAVAHAGGVRIGDRVEIQANCAISRGIFGGDTRLDDDTKLDNLVHIAHEVQVGKRCLIAASAMLAGSVTVHDDVWIGPGACISNEITVGAGARVSIGAVVTRDVAPGQRVTGNFAIDHERFVEFLRTVR